MSEESSKGYSERINKVLTYLKDHKITQFDVEHRLNYTSLSKAKNYGRYPRPVIEKKTRKELFDLLLLEYMLEYDENTGKVGPGKQKIRQKAIERCTYFIMYYYAFASRTIEKVIVKIANGKKVIMDYQHYEHWEGESEVIENYTFLSMKKMGDVTPVKKLICLFTGTRKTGNPILLGTYSTIKRDGIPAAGKVVLEQVNSKSDLNKKIKSDTDARIAHYLMNKVYVTETITPNSLDDLHRWFPLINRFSGQYLLFYPTTTQEIMPIELTWDEDSRVYLKVDKINYSGVVKPIDPHTIKIEISDKTEYSDIFESRIVLFMTTSKSLFEPFYHCVGISNALESTGNAFSCLLIEQEVYKQTPKKKVNAILEKIRTSNTTQL